MLPWSRGELGISMGGMASSEKSSKKPEVQVEWGLGIDSAGD